MGAGLFVRSLQKLNSQDAGIARESVLIVRVEPKGSDQRNIPGASQRLDRTYRDLIQRVQFVPGVRSASMAQFTPTSRRGLFPPIQLPSGAQKQVGWVMVYPNYFSTVGISLVAGRDLDDLDLSENSPPVAVVNQAFAKAAYPGENPVGKPCLITTRSRLPCQIIGVVKDSPYANPTRESAAMLYTPFLQTPTGRGQMALHVRVAASPGLILPAIREEVQKTDKDLPMFEVHTLAEEMDTALIQQRLIATLSSLFSILALLLASVGLYGLLAFTVVQRTGEMGIRMALGATRGDVVWIVLREALLLVLVGVAIGVPAALAAARLASSQISGLLFGVKATDPFTLAATALLLALVATVAGYLPARRASRADPMAALRNE